MATRVLNQAVSRHGDRFPEDFMFRLTNEEFANLRSQIVISSWDGTRYPHSTRCGKSVQGYQELGDRPKKIEHRQDIESKVIWKAIRTAPTEGVRVKSRADRMEHGWWSTCIRRETARGCQLAGRVAPMRPQARSLRPTWRHRQPGVPRHAATLGPAGPAPRRRTCSGSTRQSSGTALARAPAVAPPP